MRILSPTIGKDYYKAIPAYSSLPKNDLILETSPDAGDDHYPSSDVEGNDDNGVAEGGFSWEDNNPYEKNVGELTDIDSPQLPAAVHKPDAVGDTIEVRAHFRAFVRVELLGKWYRCSVPWPWRFHAKMKMADETVDQKDHNGNGDMVDKVWIDNGSVSDDSNDGWE